MEAQLADSDAFQAAKGGAAATLIRIETDGGHGAGQLISKVLGVAAGVAASG